MQNKFIKAANTEQYHYETMSSYVNYSLHHVIILGLPWLEKHNPHICWTYTEIVAWSLKCQDQCDCSVSQPHLKAQLSKVVSLALRKDKATDRPL